MARGKRYYYYNRMRLYHNSDDAANYGSNYHSWLELDSYAGSKGTAYYDTFWDSSWGHLIPIWFENEYGHKGLIGWVNDNYNYKASVPTLSTSNLTAGNELTITTNRQNSSYTHTVRWRFGSQAWTNIATGVGTSTSWTPSLSLVGGKIPNNVSGSFEISVITYSGSTNVGEKTVKLTITLPASVKPTVPTHTITEATSGLAAKFGSYIQGKSKLKVVSSSSGAYGSTIRSYSTKISGVTYSGATITSNTINSGGTISVVTTVTDSRGRTASKSTTVSVLAYSPPEILRLSAWRANSAGNSLDDGTFARVSQRFAITSLNNKNDKSWKVEYRQVGTSTWVQLNSGSVYDYDSAFTSASAILSTESSYELRLTISDYFTNISTSTTVGTAFTLLDFNASGKGMAIGKVSEKDALEIDMDVYVDGILNAVSLNAVSQTPSGAVQIGASDDLNNYRTPGFYYQNLNVNASTARNYPEALAGTLVVTLDSGVTQMYYLYNGAGFYYRGYYRGTWYPWRKVYHTGNLPSFAPASHNHSGENITSGTVAVARLGMTVSKTTNGYVKLPGGVIIQWGNITVPSGSYSASLTFPIAFPSACRSIVGSWQTNTTYTEAYVVSFTSPSTTKTTVYCRRADSIVDFGRVVRWIAVGY